MRATKLNLLARIRQLSGYLNLYALCLSASASLAHSFHFKALTWFNMAARAPAITFQAGKSGKDIKG